MRLGRNSRLGVDPAKNARILILDHDGVELDRVSEILRTAGVKVAALNRPDALVPLVSAFKPALAVIGLTMPDLHGTRAGRRIARRFRGAVPILYLGDVTDPAARAFCLTGGKGTDLLPRSISPEELMARVRAVLSLRAAIAKAERAELEERSPSLHDEMTGLYSRRFLLETVAVEGRRRERYGGCYSVAIAELDDFMSVRDRYGEEVCATLMARSAAVFRECLREADVLARVGRYHLGALLPGMSADGLKKLKERIALRFSQARFQVAAQSFRPSLTLGSATFPDVVGPAQQMFARAIQDLDRAREEKRSVLDRAVS